MMRASVTTRDGRTVTITIDGATYADVPVTTWHEGAGNGWRSYTAAAIDWDAMPVDHPAWALDALEWPDLETIEGLIADAIDEHQRDEHDNRYL